MHWSACPVCILYVPSGHGPHWRSLVGVALLIKDGDVGGGDDGAGELGEPTWRHERDGDVGRVERVSHRVSIDDGARLGIGLRGDALAVDELLWVRSGGPHPPHNACRICGSNKESYGGLL